MVVADAAEEAVTESTLEVEPELDVEPSPAPAAEPEPEAEPEPFFKQKTAYEISECDWSSDVCSSD
eukprot:COSAG06_NODE_55797_length_287_cov_0.492063_1_plen_65_part_01